RRQPRVQPRRPGRQPRRERPRDAARLADVPLLVHRLARHRSYRQHGQRPVHRRLVQRHAERLQRGVDAELLGLLHAAARPAAAAGINGDEIRLTTTTGANTLANLFSTTSFEVTKLDATTWRYTLKAATGVPVLQMFNAGVVNVEFLANKWTAGGGALSNVASK